MANKKVIVCDLDGTLAISKSPLTPEMADMIVKLLPHYFFAIISGGAFPQFEKQVISHLHCDQKLFKNLYIFPTMGGMCYSFDPELGIWKQLYNESLSPMARTEIIDAFKYALPKSGIDLSNPYGELIEDRGSQVTFSGRGQDAPPDIKKTWDPDKSKRMKIVEFLKEKIPQFEFHVNGSTSIDVTRHGLDKGYAVEKLQKMLSIPDEEVIFYGDALFKDGNDEPVKATGVEWIQVKGPEETLELLKKYL